MLPDEQTLSALLFHHGNVGRAEIFYTIAGQYRFLVTAAPSGCSSYVYGFFALDFLGRPDRGNFFDHASDLLRFADARIARFETSAECLMLLERARKGDALGWEVDLSGEVVPMGRPSGALVAAPIGATLH